MITYDVEDPKKPVVNSIDVLVTGGTDEYEKLGSLGVRNHVIQWARAHGLPTASGIGSIGTAPYPINEKGACTEALMACQEKIAGFQIKYTVNAGL